ncbi:MAG: bifunctional serine/threonine-protein kinase/formylglycine-generating enzyme family protein [Anaerolineales bacterium]
MEDLTGKQLGRYRVVGPLGEGGMAAVYRAYEPGLDRDVALKVLPRHFASDPQFIGRFEQEARVIAKLQHVHILPVYDFGQEDDYTFIVMPFIQTGTLADQLDDHPRPLPEILRIISQVGDALGYAHDRGIVHRDIKPTNILIDDRGNCLLTDFGIAKMVEATVQFTQSGAILGTPAYMSPEQILGQTLDGRSDLYSLGIVLFEMATGRKPYRAETPPAIFVKHLHDPLPMPRSLNADLPEAVERVILKVLTKEPADRFANASDMVRALQEAVTDTSLRAVEPAVEYASLAPTLAGKPSDVESGEEEVAESEPAPAAVAEIDESEGAPAAQAALDEHEPGDLRRLRELLPSIRTVGLILGGLVVAVVAVSILRGALVGGEEPRPIGEADEQAPAKVETPAAATAAVPPPTEQPALPTAAPATITPQSAPAAGSTQISPVDGMRQVYVPEGEFNMGADASDPDGSADEKPVHTVMLDAFWMDQTEVTNRMYRMCVMAGACDFPSRAPQFDNPDLTDHPVVGVNWRDAEDYCEWAGRRLPTEAEWEKAARGSDGRTFPWGFSAIAGHRLNFADASLDELWADASEDDGFMYSSPVGNYPAGASPYGALDMAGNVWEWVSDWFLSRYYLNSASENPAGPASSPTNSHTVRGGSFLSNARNVRAVYRFGYSPDTSAADLGFRCAMDAP